MQIKYFIFSKFLEQKSIKPKINFIFFLMINLFFSFYSCSSDDSDENLGNGNTMYADASTQYIEFETPFGFISELNNTIGVVGSSCDEEIGISLSFPIGEGVYNVSEDGIGATLNWGGCQAPFQGTWDNTYAGFDGTIIVSELNDEGVSGSFEFQGEDFDGNFRVVSNGFFDIKF